MHPSPAATFRDPGAPIADRVEDLLAHMTIEEKVAQLSGRFPFELSGADGFDAARAAELLPHGLGQLSATTAADPESLEAVAHFVNDLQEFLVERTRLGIPAICHSEALAGLLHADAPTFPAPLALAATWDPPLLAQMNDLVRRQCRAVGVHQALAPVLDVARDARWGRVPETYGEDPTLCSAMGAAFVQGLQGPDRRSGVLATAKHFVAYGLSHAGRNVGPTTASTQELTEVYLRPFEVAIRQAGLASVMSAYTELNGEPCSGSPALLTDVLRDRLGFGGFVVADYGAIGQLATLHGTSPDLSSAAVTALAAGLDVELPGTLAYGPDLVQAAAAGRIEEAVIDRSVRRVLEAKFALGLFERPTVRLDDVPAALAPGPSVRVAVELARRSLVLLENDGLLPLPLDLGRIAVIGPNADDVRALFSGYTPPAGMELAHAIVQGSSGSMAGLFETAPGPDGEPGPEGGAVPDPAALAEPFSTVTDRPPADVQAAIGARFAAIPTVLDAIRTRVPATTTVAFDEGCERNGPRETIAEAARAAASADVAVLVLGDKTGWAYDATGGEGRDRSTLDLPGHQATLLQAVCATGTPVVLVLVNGRPTPVPRTDPPVRAVLEAWQPGSVGGTAIAEALFGLVNPGGRLPITIPRSAGQCPIHYARKPGAAYGTDVAGSGSDYTNEPGTPAYPFGHGLSYTTFEYGPIEATLLPDCLRVGTVVTNTGARAGDEVVQVYLRRRGTELTQPLERLVAFARVPCEPGRSAAVTLDVPRRQLATVTRDGERHLEAGTITVAVGSSSSDIRGTGRVEVPAGAALGPLDTDDLCTVSVEAIGG